MAPLTVQWHKHAVVEVQVGIISLFPVSLIELSYFLLTFKHFKYDLCWSWSFQPPETGVALKLINSCGEIGYKYLRQRFSGAAVSLCNRYHKRGGAWLGLVQSGNIKNFIQQCMLNMGSLQQEATKWLLYAASQYSTTDNIIVLCFAQLNCFKLWCNNFAIAMWAQKSPKLLLMPPYSITGNAKYSREGEHAT